MRTVLVAIAAVGWMFPAAASASGNPAPRVEVTDLGTLGGPSSWAAAINDSGQVVGHADVDEVHRHAFLWTREGGMRDLETLGGDDSMAWGINERGWVIGLSTTTSGTSTAFLWTPEAGMIEIVPGEAPAAALGINARGDVVGYRPSNEPPFMSGPFLWTANGGAQELSEVGAEGSAKVINSKGEVAGAAMFPPRMWFWSPTSGLHDIGPLGGVFGYGPTGINARGQVVGARFVEEASAYRAFVWDAKKGMADIGGSCSGSSLPDRINDRGDVLGYCEGDDAPFIWSAARNAKDVLTMAGKEVTAVELTNDGRVVGHVDFYDDKLWYEHAFSWTREGGMVELDSDPHVLSEANAVNARGQVVGWRSYGSGGWAHATVWMVHGGR